MSDHDATEALTQAVLDAAGAGAPVTIRGGGSKDFLGRSAPRQALSTAAHRGVLGYAPTELTITARS